MLGRPFGTHIVSRRVYPGLCPGLNSSPSHSGLSDGGALAFGSLARLKPGLYTALTRSGGLLLG